MYKRVLPKWSCKRSTNCRFLPHSSLSRPHTVGSGIVAVSVRSLGRRGHTASTLKGIGLLIGWPDQLAGQAKLNKISTYTHIYLLELISIYPSIYLPYLSTYP